MNYRDKIKERNKLKTILDEEREKGKTVVQCHGCFDILHPGHLRYLEFARKQGDVLVVSISADYVVNKGFDRPYIPHDLRAENLAAVEFVDYVCIDDGTWAGPILELFKPDIYIKGKEFEHDYTGRIGRERKLVEEYGGKVVFSSGEVVYSSTYIIENQRDKINIDDEKLELLCKRNNISKNGLFEILDAFTSKRILIVGDTIVDKYVYCDALGMSSEAPVLTVAPRKTDVFLGGAAVVASHIKALGGDPYFVSIVGNDDDGEYVQQELSRRGIPHHVVVDDTRTTSVKNKYIADDKKLLNVNITNSHSIDKQLEESFLSFFEQHIKDYDAIVISDFSYGLVTPSIADALCSLGARLQKKVIADSQTSSQIGNILKFKNVTVTVPSEREARIALSDGESGLAELGKKLLRLTNNDYQVITLGPRGMIVFDKVGIDGKEFHWEGEREEGRILVEYFPSFAHYIVDPMGAGDAGIAAYALCLAADATIMESSYIASVASAIAVGCRGNVPVHITDMQSLIDSKMPT